MTRHPVDVNKLYAGPFKIFEDWLLLTGGDFASGRFNPMTVSWGSMGVIWGKPFVQVVVRPQRHTFGFMEQYDTFTVCAFPGKFKEALGVLGSKSGRDVDKVKLTGIRPEASTVAGAPSYREACLVIECRKMYWQDLDPKHFLADFIAPKYKNDYHRAYFGEVLAVCGSSEYTR